MTKSSLNWSLDALLNALPQARLVGAVDRQQTISNIVTDSRLAGAGDVFVALSGDRFDAHDFVATVAAQGAALVIVSRELPVPVAQLVVEDTRIAYGLLAKAWRSQFDLPVIAVTGSNGKTTTKEMIATILRHACGDEHVLATQGNLNNEVGVPHTLLGLRAHHRMAVIELGMNHPGEIAWLGHITQPTVALVNNAQREHQEFMASVEAVAEENGSVFKALGTSGVAVFPEGTPFQSLWQTLANHAHAATFGSDVGNWQVTAIHSPGGQQLTIRHAGQVIHCQLHALGAHNALNALAAVACTVSAGVDLQAAAKGLESFQPVNGRLQPVEMGGATLINDTYNANPDSVLAAIDVLATMPAPTVLVLGDMGEVGENGPAFHQEVGAYAAKQGVSHLMTLGDLSTQASKAFGAEASHFESIDTLIGALKTLIKKQKHTVLVKGSRFMKMERVVQALKDEVNHAA